MVSEDQVTHGEVFKGVQQQAEGKLGLVQQRLRLWDTGQSRAEHPVDENTVRESTDPRERERERE